MISRKNLNIKNNINNYYKKNKVLYKNIGPKLSSYKLKKSDYQKENIKKNQKNNNFKSNKIEDLLLNNKNQINVISNDNNCEIDEKKNLDLIVKRIKKLIKKSKKLHKKLDSYFNNLYGIYEG